MFKSVFIGSLSLFAAAAFALPDEKPQEIERLINVQSIFVASNLDRDNAKVIISGQFQNGCYRWSRATVNEAPEEAGKAGLHVLRAYAKIQQGICIQVISPFTKEVEIGALDNGTHTIKVMNGDGTSLPPLSIEIE